MLSQPGNWNWNSQDTGHFYHLKDSSSCPFIVTPTFFSPTSPSSLSLFFYLVTPFLRFLGPPRVSNYGDAQVFLPFMGKWSYCDFAIRSAFSWLWKCKILSTFSGTRMGLEAALTVSGTRGRKLPCDLTYVSYLCYIYALVPGNYIDNCQGIQNKFLEWCRAEINKRKKEREAIGERDSCLRKVSLQI